jgi:hypothetical protein
MQSRLVVTLWYMALLVAGAAAAADRNLAVDVSRAQPAGEARLALVIGNADYREAPLKNPVNDARAIASDLAQLRFRVTRLENATQEQMYAAIRAFGDALRGGGVGLLYYAGHAVQVRGRNYLIPVGANIEREDEILYRSVDANAILDKMESAGNRVNLMILDACRNNPFGRASRGLQSGLAVMEAPVNTLIGFATAPGAVASDGGGKHGLYTQHLLNNVSGAGLRVEDVFKRVRAGVRQDSAGRQVPWENTSLEVDFYFNPLPNQVVARPGATPVTDGFAIELAFWDGIKDSTDPADFRAYLRRYPNGQFADLVRNRLQVLSPPAATAPKPPVIASAARETPQAAAPPAAAPPTAAMPAPATQLASVAPAPGASMPSPAELLRKLDGPSGPVLALAVAPDGSVAAGGADRTLYQWNLTRGSVRRQVGHAGNINAAVFSPDGKLLLSGGADGQRLWNVASGAEVKQFDGHRNSAVTALSFAPTGRYVASGAADGEIIVWGVGDGAVLKRFAAHRGAVRSVEFSPDGRSLVSVSDDGEARLWDASTGAALRRFGAAHGPLLGAWFLDFGGKLLTAAASGALRLWDAASGAELAPLSDSRSPLVQAKVSADGKALLTAGSDGSLQLWNVEKRQLAWRADAGNVRALGVISQGRLALSSGDDGVLRVWQGLK